MNLSRRKFLKAAGLWVPAAPAIIPAQVLTLNDPVFFGVGGASSGCSDGGVTSAWAAQVVTNGGAAPSQSTQDAFCACVAGLKSDGVWSSIVAANFGAPDSLIAFRTPILAGNGLALWQNTAFVSGDLSANGLTGNGSSKDLQNNLNCGTLFSDGQHCGFAWYTQHVVAGGFDGGIQTGDGSLLGAANWTSGKSLGRNGTPAGTNDISVTSPGAGYYCDSRVSSIDHRLYFANSTTPHAQIGSTDTASWAGGFTNVAQFRLFCIDATGPTLFSGDTDSVFIWHTGVTALQSSKCFSRLDTLRQTIGGRV